MPLTIAIQPDMHDTSKGRNSFSPDWIDWLEERGHHVRIVDAFSPDILQALEGADGFMWRFGHPPSPRLYAKRLLHTVEKYLNIPTFPNWRTCWHYDDKITQQYMFETAEIPTPKNNIFWHREDAEQFAVEANYPLILKLTGGASSQNVIKIKNAEEAKKWIGRLFNSGVFSLSEPISALQLLKRPKTLGQRLRATAKLFLWNIHSPPGDFYELNKNYAYFQEFLLGNAYDTRITVVGNRAFGFRRFNRPNDFRASGSGKINFEHREIDQEFVRLAFKIAQAFETQSIAIDGLYRGEEHTVAEISYTYAAWAVHECPGHWVLDGDLQSDKLQWIDGKKWPQEGIIEDFVDEIMRNKE